MKNISFARRFGARVALASAALGGLVFSAQSQAVPFDYSTITAGIDWTGVTTAIGVIVLAAAGVVVVMAGGAMILGMIRKAGK